MTRLPSALLCLPLCAALLAGCGGDDPSMSAPSTSTAPVPTSPSAPATTGAPEPTSVASGVPTSDVDQQIAITFADGKATGDTGRVPVKLGSRVRIVVTSDVAEELHLHVYDRKADLVPGTPAEILFTADVPGQMELELEESKTVLVRLVVA